MKSWTAAARLSTYLTSAAFAAFPGDWTSYGYDAGGGHFSPLTGITPANVGKLVVAWTYHMDPAYGQPVTGTEQGGDPYSS